MPGSDCLLALNLKEPHDVFAVSAGCLPRLQVYVDQNPLPTGELSFQLGFQSVPAPHGWFYFAGMAEDAEAEAGGWLAKAEALEERATRLRRPPSRRVVTKNCWPVRHY